MTGVLPPFGNEVGMCGEVDLANALGKATTGEAPLSSL